MKTSQLKYILLGIFGITILACSNPFLTPNQSQANNVSQDGSHYHIVKFEMNEGLPNIGNQRVAHNGKIAKLPTVSRENYGFGGWYMDADCTKEWNFDTERVTHNLTLYAKWGRPYHTVTFETNGGNPRPEPLDIMEGVKIPEPLALRKATSAGSDNWLGFGGWYTDPDYKNLWDFSRDTMGSGDITLYAKWDIAHCLVQFEAYGGDPIPRPQDLIQGAKVIEPLAMNKNGYGFGGWYKNAEFNDPWNFAVDVVSTHTPNIILYAKWVTEYYTVTFDTNGGTPAPASQDIAFGNNVTRPPAVKNPGMGFIGWYTEPDFSKEWNFDSDTVRDNMTLYAKWDIAHYIVKFNLGYSSPGSSGHGVLIPEDQDITHGAKVSEPPSLTRAGFCFDGWYKDAGLTVEWDFNTAVTSDMILYAKWVPFVPGMVWVQKGSYSMGDDHVTGALPAHRVRLNGYYINKYQVTQEEYAKVMLGGAAPTVANLENSAYNPSQFRAGQFTRPVDNISWYDAIRYCNLRSIQEGLAPVYSLNGSTNPSNWGAKPTANPSTWDNIVMNTNANGYRLPTEAEWEYAARGGSGSPGDYVYSGSNNADDVAWYNLNSGSMTHPVGTLAPNRLGIYDMNGNVSEWCWDWYSSSYYKSSPELNPLGPSSGTERVRRGGSWNNNYTNIRTTIRNSNPPSAANYVMGFRVVRIP